MKVVCTDIKFECHMIVPSSWVELSLNLKFYVYKPFTPPNHSFFFTPTISNLCSIKATLSNSSMVSIYLLYSLLCILISFHSLLLLLYVLCFVLFFFFFNLVQQTNTAQSVAPVDPVVSTSFSDISLISSHIISSCSGPSFCCSECLCGKQ